jgi:hypothetical protein
MYREPSPVESCSQSLTGCEPIFQSEERIHRVSGPLIGSSGWIQLCSYKESTSLMIGALLSPHSLMDEWISCPPRHRVHGSTGLEN